MKNLLLSFHHQ